MQNNQMRHILGIDPGLVTTGWGVISCEGTHMRFMASGSVRPDPKATLTQRLGTLYTQMAEILTIYAPDQVAIEETFMNSNAQTSLKLGLARGALLAAVGTYGKGDVTFYAPNAIKKAITGQGHADKTQIMTMIRHLLPGATPQGHDEADALAIALCDGIQGTWHRRLG